MRRRRALGLGVVAALSLVAGLIAGAGRWSGAGSRTEERVLRAGLGSAPPTAVERAREREGAAIDHVLSYTSFISRTSARSR